MIALASWVPASPAARPADRRLFGSGLAAADPDSGGEAGVAWRLWGVGVLVEMNEYTLVDGGSRTHDANGNLTDDGTNQYVYDAFNRLVRVVREADSATIAEYAYDAQGRRVWRDVTTGEPNLDETIAYFYLGSQVVEETDAAGATQRQYVWAGGRLLQYQTTDAQWPVYVHENGYGSVMATTNEGLLETGGGILDEFDYNAYGEVVRTGGALDTGLPYLFRRWRLDAETGFHTRSSLYRSPVLGRWLTRRGGALLNHYSAYFGNNPTMRLAARRKPHFPRRGPHEESTGCGTSVFEIDDGDGQVGPSEEAEEEGSPAGGGDDPGDEREWCWRWPALTARIEFKGCTAAQLQDLAVLPENPGAQWIGPPLTNGTVYRGDGIRQRGWPAGLWFKTPGHCDVEFRCVPLAQGKRIGQAKFAWTIGYCCNLWGVPKWGWPRWGRPFAHPAFNPANPPPPF